MLVRGNNMKKLYIKDIPQEEPAVLLCWVTGVRKHKNAVFVDLYDSTGELQAVAGKETCSNFEALDALTRESAVRAGGKLNGEGLFELEMLEVIAAAENIIHPAPNDSRVDVLDPALGYQVISHPTFYVRNKKLKNIYYIGSVFKRNLQDYLWTRDFVEFQAPTLTRQTLYDDEKAIWLNEELHVSLSRCATFHLEPALMAYEKLFTITNSHSNENSRSKRHLLEYTHLKVEVCWTTLEELCAFASEMYYEVAKKTAQQCKKEFLEIIPEEELNQKIEALHPKRMKAITYDEAFKLVTDAGMEMEYGKSLSTAHETYLTKHFGESFLWVWYIPCNVEGFMFKRNENNPLLTNTCDLIAPNGFGEILGCAEKIEDYDALLASMEQKDKMKDFERYQDYAELHKYGLPPHGGIGMGVERAVRYLLDVDHIKYVKPFATVSLKQLNH